MDEKTLLERAASLDQEALAAVHSKYFDSIYRYIAFRVPDEVTAEDLTSEVFTRLLEALHAGKAPTRTLRGWLYGVASNVVSDYFRRRAPTVELNEGLPADDVSLSERADRRLQSESLLGALDLLTDEQREVIALRFGAGLSLKETAARMDRSLGSVKMLQARAVRALTGLLGKEGP